MTDRYYVTTPIYYVNAQPHLGHAYTTIVNDVLARFHRLRGLETWFLTGTDEHGDKIVQAAQAAGETPQAYADRISGMFRDTWPLLNISNDDFIRTTEPRHREVVQAVLTRVHDKGDIYFGKYGGWYCFGCERFYTEKELVDGLCPDHQKEPTFIEEENYFFRMGRYQDWLIRHIREHPDFIRPERYRNEALSFLKEPLEDLCISRPKSRLTWGIPLPFDDRFVTYVWADALINYVSALGWPDGERFRAFWPAAQHTIAKDILKPHAIYWPTLLQSAGIGPYQHLNVHGYWKIGESKMSKSVGNVVEALHMREVYGLDAFRYFLLRDMVFGLDSSFSEEALVGRINADLANDLGNLCQRSLTMVGKFGRGAAPEAARARAEGGELRTAGREAVEVYLREFEVLGFHKALIAVWELINRANKFIDREAPWALAKDPAMRVRLDEVLYELLEALALISGLIEPVMPDTAAEMRRQIGLDPDFPSLDPDEIARALSPGLPIRQGAALFPRVELGGAPAGGKASKPGAGKPAAETAAEPGPAGESISFDDFKKLDLRVGRITAAERIPKADKLLKLTVDTGEERTVVAGLAKEYSPEDMVGRQVIVVVNLPPAKLMGVKSEGMLLAAKDDDGLALLTVSRETRPGSKVS
ncbi:MAG: methionine--tRNA ligase [Proteobacteria bacterium]|nr:methionine--tRNA ligase [Pseudomonadota bacterium]